MKVIKRLAQQAEGRQWQLSRFARMMKVRLGALLLSPSLPTAAFPFSPSGFTTLCLKKTRHKTLAHNFPKC